MSFKIVTCTDMLQQWFPYLNTIKFTKVWIGKK